MTAAALTAPLDVLKTRLQSDFYQAQLRASRAAVATTPMNPFRAGVFHLQETFQILGSVHRNEGIRGLFRGLGPNLIGVVPARSINFYAYGNGKNLIAHYFNNGKEAAWVHLGAATVAGIITSTATNPIWLIKTRLQLDKITSAESGGVTKRQYKNSLDCIRQVVRNEGFRSLYKGMSASYLGVTESSLQWVLYEQFKGALLRREQRRASSGREKTAFDHTVDWTGKFLSAGSAKLFAAILTYPHEVSCCDFFIPSSLLFLMLTVNWQVARTRLRQAPKDGGRPKYTGLVQCFKLVFKEEGMLGLYGGMTPHLLRTVPSAAIMFGMYEGILHLLNVPSVN